MEHPEVKQTEGPGGHQILVVVWARRCRDWMDNHPRTGWYVVFLLTIDVVLSILDLVH